MAELNKIGRYYYEVEEDLHGIKKISLFSRKSKTYLSAYIERRSENSLVK